MDRFFGFDLGDAESAVSCLKKEDSSLPRILPVREAGSFITAYAQLRNGELLIGESACYHPDATRRRLRFKSRFLTDPESARDIKRFAAGVLGELYRDGNLVKGEDCCFYVGCPAGWNRSAREQYREIFEEAGYPPVRIISESRAALVSACQSKHFQIGYDILAKPVLVVDVGSSTTDFAYIMGGKEVELQTAGEVALGGGIMDEILLEAAVASSPKEEQIRKLQNTIAAAQGAAEEAGRRTASLQDEVERGRADADALKQKLYDTQKEHASQTEEMQAKLTEAQEELSQQQERCRILEARILGMLEQYGVKKPEADMTEREEFLELEKEKEAFDRFFERNWGTADAIRDGLKALGLVIEDTPQGARVTMAS